MSTNTIQLEKLKIPESAKLVLWLLFIEIAPSPGDLYCSRQRGAKEDNRKLQC